MVRFTSGIRDPLHLWGGGPKGRRGSSHLARVPQGVILVLVAEVTERRVDDPTGRVAQAAQAAPVLKSICDALEDAELYLRAFVREDALVRADRPVTANAAWSALSTRLMRVKAQEAVGRADDAVRVVHHDHPT